MAPLFIRCARAVILSRASSGFSAGFKTEQVFLTPCCLLTLHILSIKRGSGPDRCKPPNKRLIPPTGELRNLPGFYPLNIDILPRFTVNKCGEICWKRGDVRERKHYTSKSTLILNILFAGRLRISSTPVSLETSSKACSMIFISSAIKVNQIL
jgi:hypothetical protein